MGQPPPAHPPRIAREYKIVLISVAGAIIAALIGVFVPIIFRSTPSGGTPTTTPTSSASVVTLTPTPACPRNGKANPFVPSSSLRGNDSAIVYIDTNSDTTSLKLYDVNTKKTSTIFSRLTTTGISLAEVSQDGQWLLAILQEDGEYKLVTMQIDGKLIQTLYCLPQSMGNIQDARWSLDEKTIVFYEKQEGHPNTIYLLDVLDGTLQPELLEDDATFSYYPYAWIDNTSVYVGAFTGEGSSSTTVGYDVLSITNGANQHGNDLLRVINTNTQERPIVSISNSIDNDMLFVNYCAARPDGSLYNCRITLQPAKSSQVIYTYSIGLPVLEVRAVSGQTLLLLTYNAVNSKQNELWKMEIANSRYSLTSLNSTNSNGSLELNQFTEYPWSNVSGDGSMYALYSRNEDFSSSLLLGSMNGGNPKTFLTVPDGEEVDIVGWTTI